MHTNFAISFVDRKTIIRSTLNLLLLLYWTGHCVKRTNGRSTFHSSQVSLPTWTIFTAESVFAEEIFRRRMDLHTYIEALEHVHYCQIAIVKVISSNHSSKVFPFTSFPLIPFGETNSNRSRRPVVESRNVFHLSALMWRWLILHFMWISTGKKKNRHKKWNVTSSPQ